MRIKVTFEIHSGDYIDINYQYALAAWVYRILNKCDTNVTSFLHDKGFSFTETDNRRYKFFTLSNLNIPKYRVEGRKIYIQSFHISFIFSTYINEIGYNFIKGIMSDRGFYIGKYLKVGNIEALKETEIKSGMTFRTISPVFVQHNSIHLHPLEHKEIYSASIHKNLTSKYNVFYSTHKDFMPTSIKVISKVKTKILSIKEGRETGTRIKANLFTFKIKGDPELIEIGYKSGFGQNNAMGFGCVEIVDSPKPVY